MNKEEEVIKKLNEYSSECHTQLAYSINGYRRKHPGDLRLCMYETDVILIYIKDLQHQLEEKDKVIDEAREFLKEFHNYENRFKWCEEDYIQTILKLEKILERSKNGK